MPRTRHCRRHLILFLAVTTIAGCLRLKSAHLKQRFYRMDTITEVTVVAPRTAELTPLWNGIDSLLLSWEHRFSVEREGSEVYALNHASDTAVVVSPELADMLREAQRWGDTLHGGFDITILPLKRLWGLDERTAADTAHVLPSDSAIADALRYVDRRLIRVNPDKPVVIRPRGILIDVGGIAKGYALRSLCAFLDRRGFRDYLVSSGGDIQVAGRRRDNTPWIVGIQHPRDRNALLATVRVSYGCVVTSGDYERFWNAPDGRRIHHIFDPRTGCPCTRNQSVTIWSRDPVQADVFSTGLFCRPAGDIVSFVERRAGLLECVVVDSGGTVHVSRGWVERIQRR